MSDIMIPGVTNSGFDTDSMLDDIMDAERSSMTRMEERIDEYEEERLAWQELGRRISNLQEAANLLFGFENPFNDRIATSTDERALEAVADRSAPEGLSRIKILQLAEADRFVSRDLPNDFAVSAGRYGFRVGENEEYFNYSGGSLESFANAINQRANDVISARVVPTTSSTKVILIEALLTGSENRLTFLEASRDFAIEASILEQVLDQTVLAYIEPTTVTGWTKPTASAGIEVTSGLLRVEPGGEAALRFPQRVVVDGAWTLELEVQVTNTYTEWVPPVPPPGPDTPDAGSITLGDITIENIPSQVPVPQWQSPEPPEVNDDLQILFVQSGETVVPLLPLNDTDGFVKLQIPLADYVSLADGLNLRNRNTHRTVTVRNISVFDPRSRGDMVPVNALSTANDAIVEYEGIRVTRSTNTIDDLLDRVTLNLKRTTTDELEVTVEPDRESITDSLIGFVFYYNELIREINILTRSEQAIIDEITNFSDEEREDALEKLGLLQGDLTLNSLRSRLQTIMMNPYPTSAGNELILLAQLGVSSNAAGPGGGFDSSRLRGYMEMNPQVVETALQKQVVAVRQLFGSDSDGDSVIDTGVGFEVDRLARPYVQTNGVISTRTGTIEGQVARTEDRIEREEARLERVEAQYREDFARMEGALGSLEDSQRTLENLPSGNSGQ